MAYRLGWALVVVAIGKTVLWADPSPAFEDLVDPTVAPPPAAELRPVETTLHGDTLVDPYAWLRNLDDPAVMAHLQAESDYADAVLASAAPLTERLLTEMAARLSPDASTYPERWGDSWYFHKVAADQEYWDLMRRRGAIDGPAEPVLDLNALASAHDYFDLVAWEPTHDGRKLAYLVDTTGGLEFTLHLKDLETGATIGDPIGQVAGAAWAPDGQSVFYIAADEALRGYELRRHWLDGDRPDQIVYTETDPEFSVYVTQSRDRRFMVIGSASGTTSEVRFLDPYDPAAELIVLVERREGILYGASHGAGHVYMRINDTGLNSRIVSFTLEDHLAGRGEDAWRTLVPHRDDVVIESFGLQTTFLDLTVRRNGLREVEIVDLASGQRRQVRQPDAVYALYPRWNAVYDTDVYTYGYESFARPESVYSLNVFTGETALVWQLPVPGDFDPARYETRRAFATAEDGTQVPVSLVFAADTPLDGTAPLLLEAYGAYGATYDPFFDITLLSLLDRGMVYAFAHVRGGGEYGLSWYNDGRLSNKINTFTDVVAVAEHLVDQGYAAPDRLVLTGASAGGLMAGAVLNRRPDLFTAAVLNVPFVDVLTAMLDPGLPLTTLEYGEWGNPERAEEYAWIRDYDPYHTIPETLPPGDFPDVLVLAGLTDDQVPVWQPAKYVARLRQAVGPETAVLFSVDMGTGHGGDPGRFAGLRRWAEQYAFVLRSVGIAE